MAWTDQCRVAFKVNTNALLMKRGGKGIIRLLRQVSRESGIPYPTLKTWWYEKEEVSRNQETQNGEIKEKERPMCRVCGETEVELTTRTGKPVRTGITRMMCSPCRKKVTLLTRKAKEATEGIETACPDCGRHFYVKED